MSKIALILTKSV